MTIDNGANIVTSKKNKHRYMVLVKNTRLDGAKAVVMMFGILAMCYK